MHESTRDAAAEFTRLIDIMRTLLGPNGCPWDREQTIDSLKAFVLEETYEVLESIDHHDHSGLCEELGDFIFEAVFLAELESEAGYFTITDSLKSIADKLVRRHPHVFARDPDDAKSISTERVRAQWDEIKAQEKLSRGATSKTQTALAGVAPTLPALLRAYQIGVRAGSAGFDWTNAKDVIQKLQEEVDEIREVVVARPEADRAHLEEEMGDLLFAIANLSRKLGIEPETALRKANDKFTRRFEAMGQFIATSGRAMRDMSLDELEHAWRHTKSLESTS